MFTNSTDTNTKYATTVIATDAASQVNIWIDSHWAKTNPKVVNSPYLPELKVFLTSFLDFFSMSVTDGGF